MKSLSAKILDTMAIVPDFPKQGVMFRDITPVLRDPQLFNEIAHCIKTLASAQDADVIAGVEARGFILASAAAVLANKPLVLLRKPGKLPGRVITFNYDLEYGTDQLCLKDSDIQRGQRVTVVDDVLATGGTSNAASMLVQMAGGIPSHVFLLELKDLIKRPLADQYSSLISL